MTPEHSRAERAPSLTTSERLILAVVRAARQARAPTTELRDAVCAYVHELKEREYPPERVLVAVKALVADAGLKRTGPWIDRRSASIHPEAEVMDHVVAWCIEEYFPLADGRRSALGSRLWGEKSGGAPSAERRAPSALEP